MSETEMLEMPAAEYVLGVLEPAEMQAVATRALTDRTLAAEISWWEQRLLPLTEMVPEVAPPAALWPRIESSIGAATVRVAPAAGRTRVWQAATAASLALAAAFAAIAFVPRAVPPPLPPAPLSLTALAPLGAQGPAFVARALPDGRLQLVSLGVARVPSGRDLELWALPAGAAKPVALGVLPATGMVIAQSDLTAPGGKLLISLEPKGGSPTGQPTGPVLYGGVITPL